ncbi:hypothetical protein JXC34_01815 [Candidatus Woesearchaeota archaeon]|nr:hypothetical protein [Candidatus Woesearchaeota archaeon]
MESITSVVKSSVKTIRKCILCEEREAEYCIKGLIKDCYCKECALEQFSDLGLLEKIS